MSLKYRKILKKSLLIASSCLLALPAWAEAPRPKYSHLRFTEDWSVLQNQPASDYLDPIKYIPLNDSGDIYMSLGGSLRLRGESWSNLAFNEANDGMFGLGQIMLHGDLHLWDYARLYVEGKSALSTDRTLPGGNRTIDVDTLALQNLFVDLKMPLGDHASILLRPGRQEIDLGKERLISSLRWVNSRRNFDAVRLTGVWNQYTVDALYSQLVNVDKTAFNTSSPNTSFYGLYASGPLPETPLKSDLYWLGLHNFKSTPAETATNPDVTSTEDRQTLGFRVSGALPWYMDTDTEIGYQFGRLNSNSISAFFGATEWGVKPPDWFWNPRFYAGFDYASGDSDSTDTTVGTFNQYFPLAHAYYGFADMLGRQNAMDARLGFALKPLNNLTVKVDGHSFLRSSTQDAIYSVAGSVFKADGSSDSAYIGSELDLTLAYTVDSHLSFLAGYSFFMPGAFLSDSGASAPLNFGYLQTAYVF